MGFIKNYFFKKREIGKLYRQLDLIKRFPKEKYLGYKLITSKKGRIIFLVHTAFLNLDIIDYGSVYIISGETVNLSSNRLSYVVTQDPNGSYLLIADIIHDRINEGIGTELLNYVDEIARAQGLSFIKGYLSNRDFDHTDRLLHFYQKNGFSIATGAIPGSNMEGQIVIKYL